MMDVLFALDLLGKPELKSRCLMFLFFFFISVIFFHSFPIFLLATLSIVLNVFCNLVRKVIYHISKNRDVSIPK